MRTSTRVALLCAGLLAGCASEMNLLRTTVTGGDALPAVTVSPLGQVDVSAINVGDTVAYAPGSMRAIAKSPTFTVSLVEPKSQTDGELQRALSVNRREGAKIEIMKGQLRNGDMFEQHLSIDMSSNDTSKDSINLTVLVFNRGSKPFRGNLVVFDRLPPELEYLGTDQAAKYNDQRQTKDALSWVPFLGMLAMAMDNYSRSDEAVEMAHDRLDDIHRYTFRRMVLEPGQAVGFVVRTRYKRPSSDELEELRLQAAPVPAMGLQ